MSRHNCSGMKISTDTKAAWKHMHQYDTPAKSTFLCLVMFLQNPVMVAGRCAVCILHGKRIDGKLFISINHQFIIGSWYVSIFVKLMFVCTVEIGTVTDFTIWWNHAILNSRNISVEINFDGVMEDRSNSSGLAMELLQSCTKSSKCTSDIEEMFPSMLLKCPPSNTKQK